MKLYEIQGEIAGIILEIEASGGEITPEQEKRLDELSLSKEEKVQAICSVIREKEAELSAFIEEMERFKEKAFAKERELDSIKNYLSRWIGHGNTFKAGLFTIGWRAGKSVKIVDESLIPDWYWKEETVRKLDKKEIKNDMESSVFVPGAELEVKQHIQIK